MKRVWLDYIVDVGIGIAFILSAISGLAFLAPVWFINYSGVVPTFLGLDDHLWDTLHTYGSLVMIGGVLLHLVLHWKWIITMTKRLVRGAARLEQS